MGDPGVIMMGSLWQVNQLGQSNYPTDHVCGLQLTFISVSQVRIETGECRDDADSANIILTSPVTVDIEASGANGLDTGSEAADTWYYVWLIRNPTTDAEAGLLSLSSSSPTMPSGYTEKRYIGSLRNNGGSNIREFLQRGVGGSRAYNYLTVISSRQVLNAGSATVLTAIGLSSFVPPTTQNAHLFVRQQGTPNLFMAQDTGGQLLDGILPGGSVSLSNFPTDTSQDVAYMNDAGGGDVDIFVRGYSEGI